MANEEKEVKPYSWEERIENLKFFLKEGDYESIFWHWVIPLFVIPAMFVTVVLILPIYMVYWFVNRTIMSIRAIRHEPAAEQERSAKQAIVLS